MLNDELSRQSTDFAVQIINLVKGLKAKHETVISNQIGRSGTSIGAKIRSYCILLRVFDAFFFFPSEE